MKKSFFARKYFITKIFAILFICSLFFLLPSAAQEKPSTGSTPKKKAAKKSFRGKVFYGEASFYANEFNGRRTSNGQIFNQSRYTCACNMLPLGTWVNVTNVKNGRSVVVQVNDRLHPRMRRVADLSKSAAKKLGYLAQGVARVKMEVLGKEKPR